MANDLVTSPAFAVIKAADEFDEKTTRPHQLRQIDFTYLKVIGWGLVLPLNHSPPDRRGIPRRNQATAQSRREAD